MVAKRIVVSTKFQNNPIHNNNNNNNNNNHNHNNNRRGQSPHISSVNKSVNKGKNSAVKENSFLGELPNAGNTNAHYRKLSTVNKTTAKKIKLRNKSGNINQSSFLT